MLGNDQILLVHRDFAKWRVKKKKKRILLEKHIFVPQDICDQINYG